MAGKNLDILGLAISLDSIVAQENEYLDFGYATTGSYYQHQKIYRITR